jgi:hypothetical protein
MTDFLSALSDYRYFKNRGYPHKSVLKIIGDRYRLSTHERNCLFRGVVDTDTCSNTKKKLVLPESIPPEPIGLDWFNVVITMESYLKGYTLFVSDDGIVRDSSGVHGSYKISQISIRAMQEIISAINSLPVVKVDAFIDSPISHSGEIATMLREYTETKAMKQFDIFVVKSADYQLKNYKGIIASSDTVIIEHSNYVFDLPKYILNTRFGYSPPNLDSLVLQKT